MKTKILILLSIIIASASEGDMNLTTPDGRVIILHEDGTWEYKPVTNLVPIEWNTNCKYTKNKIDDFSGEKMRVTKSIFLGKSDIKKKLYFYYSSISDENGNTIFLNFTGFGDLGCLTPTSSKVILKFEDDEMLELKYIGKTDCSNDPDLSTVIFSDDSAVQRLLISEDELLKFQTMRVEMIRIHGSKYYSDMYIDYDKQHELAKQFQCVN